MKTKKKHGKIVLLAKSKLNSIEALISKALINSNISHDKFVLKNVLNKYDDWKKTPKFKDLNSYLKVGLFIKQHYYNVWSVEKIKEVKIQKL